MHPLWVCGLMFLSVGVAQTRDESFGYDDLSVMGMVCNTF